MEYQVWNNLFYFTRELSTHWRLIQCFLFIRKGSMYYKRKLFHVNARQEMAIAANAVHSMGTLVGHKCVYCTIKGELFSIPLPLWAIQTIGFSFRPETTRRFGSYRRKRILGETFTRTFVAPRMYQIRQQNLPLLMKTETISTRPVKSQF